MKTSSISLLVVVFSVASQTTLSQSVFDFGIKAGVSSSWLVFKNRPSSFPRVPSLDYDRRTVNPFISAFLRNRSIESLPILLEFQYVRMGGASVISVPLTPMDSREGNGTYIDYRSEIGIPMVTLALGVEPTIRLGSMELYARITPTLNHILTVDNFAPFDDKYTWTLLGYQLGAGVRFPWSDQSDLILEAIYTQHAKPFFSHSTFGQSYTNGWLATIGATL